MLFRCFNVVFLAFVGEVPQMTKYRQQIETFMSSLGSSPVTAQLLPWFKYTNSPSSWDLGLNSLYHGSTNAIFHIFGTVEFSPRS